MITPLYNAIFESLKSLEQGQFQQFCKSLLPLIEPLYEGLESHGMTLDGKTRKGTPDLLKTFGNGKQIAVQCSVDKSYWKLPKKEINIYKSKPCIDIDKCIYHLLNLEEIILCSNQIIPTNAPNAKARILKYAKRKIKVPINIFSAYNICELLIRNRHRESFEALFKKFFTFFYETFISALAKKRMTWDELIEVCHSQVQTEIQSKIGNKYIPKLYVHREKEKEIASFIVSGTEALVGLYKNMQTIVNEKFQRLEFYIVDLSLLDNHDAIFLPSPDRRRKIGFFLDNLSGNLKEKMEPMKGKSLGSREKEIWAAMTTLQEQIDEMKRLLNGLFIIIDRAGSGKTNILCKIAEEYSKILPTIFITGRQYCPVNF